MLFSNLFVHLSLLQANQAPGTLGARQSHRLMSMVANFCATRIFGSLSHPSNLLVGPVSCLGEHQSILSAAHASVQQKGYAKEQSRWSNYFRTFTFIRARDSIQVGRTLCVEGPPAKHFIWSDTKRPHICILGGGFGGLYTALRLESLVWPPDKQPQVLLIDQSDRFVFKPLLYELLSREVDPWEIAPLFTDLFLNTSIKFLKDKVTTVSPRDGFNKKSTNMAVGKAGGTVLLESGCQIDYDWLVLALGSEAKTDIVPGAAEYAFPFSTLEDALEVDRQLRILERERFGLVQFPIHIVVVGSGYCGAELAATLAERLGDHGKVVVVDVGPDICSTALAGNREAANKVLSSRNVELKLGYIVTGVRKLPFDNDNPMENSVPHPFVLDLRPASKSHKWSGHHTSTLKADLILWTVGSRPCLPFLQPYQGSQYFPINGRGQTETDETLRVKGHPQIFAIGDSASLRDSSGRLLPTTAQVALQQADYAGWNLWAAINNRPLLPFRYQNLGEMMTLGRNDAAVTLSFIDSLTLEGPLGHTARKLAYLRYLPTNEHRAKVALSWLTKSAIETVATLQDKVMQFAISSSNSFFKAL